MHKLIAYQVSECPAEIRPAPRERKWLGETDQKFAYRCLPLVVANQFGWELLLPQHVRAVWDGTSRREGLRVERLSGDGPDMCQSHFGSGILSFLVPYLFRTPPGWNLLVRGPANTFKDGIAALDGVIETDWAHMTFTMNWRFTRACSVEFARGEPICSFFPVPRGLFEQFQCEIQPLGADQELQRRYEGWIRERGDFLKKLEQRDPQAVEQGWQRTYMASARETKLQPAPFRKAESR